MPKSRGSAKSKLDFDGFLEAFRDDSNTFAAIGERAGISRQAVHQIYHKFFAQLFRGGRVKRSRMSSRTAKRMNRRRSQPSEDPFMQRVFLEAHRLGLPFRRVPAAHRAGNDQFLRRVVEIDGVLYSLHRIERTFYPSDHHLYGYTPLCPKRSTLTRVGGVIVWRSDEDCGDDYFIAPSQKLLAEFGPGEEEKSFYIPVWFPKRRRQRPTFDWLPYKDAWHLLSQNHVSASVSG